MADERGDEQTSEDGNAAQKAEGLAAFVVLVHVCQDAVGDGFSGHGADSADGIKDEQLSVVLGQAGGRGPDAPHASHQHENQLAAHLVGQDRPRGAEEHAREVSDAGKLAQRAQRQRQGIHDHREQGVDQAAFGAVAHLADGERKEARGTRLLVLRGKARGFGTYRGSKGFNCCCHGILSYER